MSAATFARIADREATVLLSAVSSWEIAIKWSLGRLPLPEPPPGTYIPSRMRHDGVDALAVTHVPRCTSRRCPATAATPSTAC